MPVKVVHVAVGVIVNEAGQILIAKRPENAHQGGLWEFPGGKVEAGETLFAALARELREELAIEIAATEPLIQIRHDYTDKSVLLDVHRVTQFSGEPCGNEGQPVIWVSPSALSHYNFPAANRPIITAINLPSRMLITGSFTNRDDLLQRIGTALDRGIRLVQLRLDTPGRLVDLAGAVAELCNAHSALLQLNTSPELFHRCLAQAQLPAGVGLHLNRHQLLQLVTRPVDESVLLSASCHSPEELVMAMQVGVDFVCLSPVLNTASHPGEQGLGWAKFQEWTAPVPLPVYALGGLCDADLPTAIAAGAQGIAGISAWWY